MGKERKSHFCNTEAAFLLSLLFFLKLESSLCSTWFSSARGSAIQHSAAENRVSRPWNPLLVLPAFLGLYCLMASGHHVPLSLLSAACPFSHPSRACEHMDACVEMWCQPDGTLTAGGEALSAKGTQR